MISKAVSGTPIKQVVHKTENSKSLTELVKAQHKFKSAGEVILIFKKLEESAKRLDKDVHKVVESITNKIFTRKEAKFKNAQDKDDEQAKWITNVVLKPSVTLDIHNYKSIVELFEQKIIPEFQLTEDEMNLIIITSIDPDYFTHLLMVQANFAEWF